MTDHLLTTGSLFGNIANNYDKFNYTNPPNDSKLPRVRTRVREYVQNDAYVNNLQANFTSSTSAMASTAGLRRLSGNHVWRRGGGSALSSGWTATGRLVLMLTTLNSVTGAARRT